MNCIKCNLSKYSNQVIGRGSSPADILFIGEAPGKTENLLRLPFVGRSGKLLDIIIKKVFAELGQEFTYYITNTVQCRPCDGRSLSNREPAHNEVLHCRDNLLKVHGMVNPSIVIFLGEVAERWNRNLFPEAFKLPHPAYLLRQGGEASSEFIRTTVNLKHILMKGLMCQ